MAKKKTSNRKHKFKYAEPTPSSGAPVMASSSGVAATMPRPVSAVALRDFSYVSRDVRKVIVIAAILILFELILWYIFGHSSLGKGVYSIIPV